MKGTHWHLLETAEGGMCQGIERKGPSEGTHKPGKPSLPQCEREHFLLPAARLHEALVGTEFACDLGALLGNGGGLALCGQVR